MSFMWLIMSFFNSDKGLYSNACFYCWTSNSTYAPSMMLMMLGFGDEPCGCGTIPLIQFLKTTYQLIYFLTTNIFIYAIVL